MRAHCSPIEDSSFRRRYRDEDFSRRFLFGQTCIRTATAAEFFLVLSACNWISTEFESDICECDSCDFVCWSQIVENNRNRCRWSPHNPIEKRCVQIWLYSWFNLLPSVCRTNTRGHLTTISPKEKWRTEKKWREEKQTNDQIHHMFVNNICRVCILNFYCAENRLLIPKSNNLNCIFWAREKSHIVPCNGQKVIFRDSRDEY